MWLNWVLALILAVYRFADTVATGLQLKWLFNFLCRVVRFLATGVLQLVLKVLGFTTSSTPPPGSVPPAATGGGGVARGVRAVPGPAAPGTNIDTHFGPTLIRDIEDRCAGRLARQQRAGAAGRA